MPKTLNNLAKKTASTPKEAIAATFLVANAFVWYLSGFSYLQDATISKFNANSLYLMAAANFLSLILTAFATSLLSGKFRNRLTFLKYWVIAGVLISILFATINLSNFSSILVLAIVTGMYFGVGMPICMGHFAKTSAPQNRAKLGGLIILLIGLGFPLISIIGSSETIVLAATLAVWQILALISILPIKPAENQIEATEKVTYRSVLSNKTFLLYAAPWLMFSLINELTMKLNTNYFNSTTFPSLFGQNFTIVENVLAGGAAIVCGILADKKGRKRLALTGFALLGIGYASLGLFSGNIVAAWFYVCLDGIAWGAFSSLFLVTIWGDIAQDKNSEKYYFLGVLPYLFSSFAGILMGTFISVSLEETTVFAFASFFLFVAILPLAYAPETLSDKIIRNLDLNSYVNKALEKVKKDSANR